VQEWGCGGTLKMSGWIRVPMELNDITYKINGCAMKVHNKLDKGFQEVIYQRCLEIKFTKAKLNFGREIEQDIYYDGIIVGTRRADFIVEDCVIVELKAVIRLEDVHLAQAKNYVVMYNFPIGLLINFGSTSLEFKKVFNNNDRYKIGSANTLSN
jgi:GxxExxY protein